MKLVIAPSARMDLLEIGDYIAGDSQDRAQAFVSDLIQRCDKLLIAPFAGRQRDDIVAGFRSVPFGRYVIFYTMADDVLRIERILHSARNLRAIFDDED